MKITWDENKNKLNIKDHGLSFQIAKLVFDDPLCITRHDRIENGEERWQTIGQIDGKYVVLVAHTYPEIDEVRIISARRLLKKERKHYEECTNKKTARRTGRS